ncbi:MAG: hypothetical protein AAFP97_01990 [Pseudomonadota bacterium]
MALVSCIEKPNRSGTTFSELTLDLEHPGFSLLSCAMDINRRPCDPFRGDTVCDMALPVACYSSASVDVESSNEQLSEAIAARLARFRVDGQIRVTQAVKGNRFETRQDVNNFCRVTFGEGFRVLSFHESGAPGILSRNKIEPGQRLWVDVRDQPKGNCWDADGEDPTSARASPGGR